jgi:hypothetical protein
MDTRVVFEPIAQAMNKLSDRMLTLKRASKSRRPANGQTTITTCSTPTVASAASYGLMPRRKIANGSGQSLRASATRKRFPIAVMPRPASKRWRILKLLGWRPRSQPWNVPHHDEGSAVVALVRCYGATGLSREIMATNSLANR